MKSTRNLRKNVTLAEKLNFLNKAIDLMSRNPKYHFKTDLIGIACQFTSQPKLKRKDFQGISFLSLLFANDKSYR